MKIYLMVLLLLSGMSFSQDMEKDTIELKEVVIHKKLKKAKITKIKYNSKDILLERLDEDTEVVTLLDKVPEGYITAIRFYFNDSFFKIEGTTNEIKDVELELIFYETNADGTPGRKIVHDRKVILVGKEHRGKMDIDVSALNISTRPFVFLGVKRLTPDDGANFDFEMDCIFGPDGRFTSYCRKNNNAPWRQRDNLAAIKMEVSVAVQ